MPQVRPRTALDLTVSYTLDPFYGLISLFWICVENCADTSFMYRQILIRPDQARFQRILFRGDPEGNIEDYKLKTVIFGVNCAPYLVIRILHQLASDCG